MSRIIILAAVFLAALISCDNPKTEKQMTDNPILATWDTPFGVPPFEQIKNEDYLPAYKKAIEIHDKELEDIVNSKEEPNFENTIAALDYSGELLRRVDNLFQNINEANTNPEMQKIAKEVAPLLSAHQDNIWLNEQLFARVKTVNDKKDQLNLTTEQKMLLARSMSNFHC